jgi:hypothetical protein
MPEVAGRPVGLAFIAAVLGLNGVVALVEACVLAVSATGDWAAIALEGAIGAMLFSKAFALLSFHPAGWLLTVLTLGLHTAIVGDEITRGHAPVSNWFALSFAVISILYLTRPPIRSLFTASETSRQ